ncbi:hypothetical protein TRFO_36170 [Tritrichomonas foetus]|uniref:Uncharacterized protein n=1 Tax=Tritrichomonas foetus TaxID=1144522 RepID=A0A1J4JH23_9EUKA|nr:hypothetical protein TRFO_36170 [Tritrichomonas foetus]|eukprot:OHS97567.1 hypothetical protein TRFO_36170 [Tritrichomonas foetus]
MSSESESKWRDDSGDYKEESPLSKIIEGAVSAYCGNRFSLVLIGNSPLPLPEAETLFSMSKRNNQSLNKHFKEENQQKKTKANLKV